MHGTSTDRIIHAHPIEQRHSEAAQCRTDRTDQDRFPGVIKIATGRYRHKRRQYAVYQIHHIHAAVVVYHRIAAKGTIE